MLTRSRLGVLQQSATIMRFADVHGKGCILYPFFFKPVQYPHCSEEKSCHMQIWFVREKERERERWLKHMCTFKSWLEPNAWHLLKLPVCRSLLLFCAKARFLVLLLASKSVCQTQESSESKKSRSRNTSCTYHDCCEFLGVGVTDIAKQRDKPTNLLKNT